MHHLTKITAYILIIFVAISINFALPRMMPGDPITSLTDDPTTGMPVIMDEDLKEEIRSYYGLDKPISEQFTGYLKDILKCDLGWSIYYNAPVAEVIFERLKWTLLLVGTSTLIYMILGIFLGAVSAWKRGERGDLGLLVSVLSIGSFPSFFLAMLFIILFGVKLDIFPIFGATTPFMEYSSTFDAFKDVLYHLILPASTLVLTSIDGPYLLMRNSMLGVLGEDYIVTARAKGLTEWAILKDHAIKNALLPITTVIAIRMGFMISGAIFVETVFAYPGIGKLLYDAVSFFDYPLLQGAFLIITLIIIAANFIADMTYLYLDPRVKHG